MTKVLVTGGGGFLGTAIVKELVKSGYQVRVAGRNHYPHLDALGVEQVTCDIEQLTMVRMAVSGCDAVIHTAAKAGISGSFESYFKANVLGTRHVIDACKINGVRHLVYTSSPSVTFGGIDQDGVDESIAYPDRYLAPYPQTKAIAEREVMQANSPFLQTVSLRPHLIWGPNDPHFAPKIWDVGSKRGITLIKTKGAKKLVDAVYVDNAAYSHRLALEKLSSNAPIGGKAYFITNHEPWTMEELVNRILAVKNLGPVKRFISPWAAMLVAHISERVHQWFGLKSEPVLTRFVASQLMTSHWYNPSNAQKDLGYEPTISMDEGMNRLKSAIQSVAMDLKTT